MRRFLMLALSLSLLSAGAALKPAGPAAASTQTVAQQTGGPAASFTSSVGSQSTDSSFPRVHDLVTFNAGQSPGSGLTYSWSFGDRSPAATGKTVTHAFGLVDDYHVTLTVTDASGQTGTATKTLRVTPLVQMLVSNPPQKQIAIGSVIPATLYIQAPGPATVNADLSGDLINGKPVAFSTPDQLAFVTLTGQVATESNDTINNQIIQKPGGSVPLKGNVGVEVSYDVSTGDTEDLVFTLDLQKDVDPARGDWSITYPNFSLITGTPDPSQPDVGGYYLKGDPGFHHPDDPLVRHYAMQAARDGGALPDDPGKVAGNIFSFVRGLFGSDDPANLEPDTTVVQKIDSGELVPGERDEKYICISQTYFLSSLTRTLGLPTRELTVALANPVSQDASGTWTVDYVQEGSAQVWYAGDWHLYDTWYGLNQFDDYLTRQGKYAYQAWYANSPQNFQLIAKNGDPLGLYGHDFAIGEYVGTPAAPDQWTLLQRKTRTGIAVAGWPTGD